MLRKFMYAFMGIMMTVNPVFADKQADYVIVGLGTAGCVLARYLSDPVNGKYKNSVIVVEAGRNFTQDPVISDGPAQIINHYGELSYNPKYSITSLVPESNILLAGLANGLEFSNGRGWGGTSAHNGMNASRASSDSWDDLSAYIGNNNWSYNKVLPLLKFLETYNGATTQPLMRGTSGILQISRAPEFASLNYPNVISAVTGSPILPDFNVPEGNLSVAVGQSYTSPTFTNRSYAMDFLPPTILSPEGEGLNGRKLTVISGAFVDKVLFDKKKKEAIGVEYCCDGDNKRDVVFARKKVILCAGCPFSAAILQRSGVGAAAVLNQPNIEVPQVLEQPLVGQGLKTHIAVIVAATQPTDPAQKLTNSANCFTDGRGFYAPAGAGDGVRRFYAQFFNNLAILPKGLLSALNYPSFAGIAAFLFHEDPRSSGWSNIADSSPFTFPDIRFNLYSDGPLTDPKSDLSAMVSMLKLGKAIVDNAGPGSTLLYPPASHFVSDAILAQDVGAQLTFSQFTVAPHYCGTCNMGSNISNSVVNSETFEVHGLKNLMVADLSVFPKVPRGNPAMGAYLVGLKAAIALGYNLSTEE